MMRSRWAALHSQGGGGLRSRKPRPGGADRGVPALRRRGKSKRETDPPVGKTAGSLGRLQERTPAAHLCPGEQSRQWQRVWGRGLSGPLFLVDKNPSPVPRQD